MSAMLEIDDALAGRDRSRGQRLSAALAAVIQDSLPDDLAPCQWGDRPRENRPELGFWYCMLAGGVEMLLKEAIDRDEIEADLANDKRHPRHIEDWSIPVEIAWMNVDRDDSPIEAATLGYTFLELCALLGIRGEKLREILEEAYFARDIATLYAVHRFMRRKMYRVTGLKA